MTQSAAAACPDAPSAADTAAANTNNRFYGGFRFIAGVVMLGFEVSYTVLGSFNDPVVGTFDMKPVLTYNSTIGFDF